MSRPRNFFFGLPLVLLQFLFAAPAYADPAPPPGMVYVPEGYFQMGAAADGEREEKPLHMVYTAGFFIDKYEVSNTQYGEFMKATKRPAPKFWNDARFNKPDYPVVGVTWYDAAAYAHWKNRRLPTEAEWEKAARGPDGRSYPWGGTTDKNFLSYAANLYGTADNFPYTAPVNYFVAGASPFGTLNMAGNVWEWCSDWYLDNYYSLGPELNPEGPAEETGMKVLRGGSWINSIGHAQTFRRARNRPEAKTAFYGFRTVQPVK